MYQRDPLYQIELPGCVSSEEECSEENLGCENTDETECFEEHFSNLNLGSSDHLEDTCAMDDDECDIKDLPLQLETHNEAQSDKSVRLAPEIESLDDGESLSKSQVSDKEDFSQENYQDEIAPTKPEDIELPEYENNENEYIDDIDSSELLEMNLPTSFGNLQKQKQSRRRKRKHFNR